MKKLFGILFIALMSVVAVSCSSNSKANAVAQKLEQNEELTQEDYTVMLNYCIETLDYAINEIKALKESPTKEQIDELDKKAEEKYPHMESFNKAISRANNKDFDETNKELYKTRTQKMLEMMSLLP